MRKLLASAALLLCLCAGAGAEEYSWKAKWISKQYYQSETNSWLAFRKDIDIEKVPESLVARIAVDTKYWLWINGEPVVYEGGLKRGPSIGGGYYDKVEIAPYLKKGGNRISVLVWFMGKAGFSHMSSGTCALLFDARSPEVEILSDETWECSAQYGYGTASHPITNYRLSESNIRYDANLFDYNWFRTPIPGPEERPVPRKAPEWLGSSIELPFLPGDAPMGELVERPIPQWKNYGLKEYPSTRLSGDTLYCKLPYNGHFSPWFKVEAPKGKVISMHTDHDMISNAKCVSAEYVTRDGVQEYESFGWMNGEVLYYVFPKEVKVLEVKFRETGYDAEFTGSFSCSDPLLNEYWQKAQRTLYVCMRDTYYDCPDRERAQWWGDEVNELNEAFYLLDRKADKLARKGIMELVRWHKPDGVMYAPIPCSNYFKELPMQVLNSIGWYGFRGYAFYSGDYSFVKDVYPAVHRYLHEVWKLDSEGLPIYRKGGWDWPDAGAHQDRVAQLHLWYYLALKAEAEFARVLGKEAEAAEDEDVMFRIATVLNSKYWNGSAYVTPGFEDLPDDRVQALAVISGIASPDRYPLLKKVFAERYNATTYMFPYVLDALYTMGEPQMALDRMRKMYPTVMKDSCSTLYEHWNYDGTCNHAWTGGGVVSMVRRLAGVDALAPGYQEFEVKPQMGDLKWLKTGFETNYGRIEVSLVKKGRRIEAEITVPEGTTCRAGGRILAPGTHKVRLS
ncbi:MAG: glycoside hydrolase [Bacteroidales bacterium]|nr:glycoside hydrolase [Bacteroidales bacterium]